MTEETSLRLNHSSRSDDDDKVEGDLHAVVSHCNCNLH